MVRSAVGLFYSPWQGRTQLHWVDTPGLRSPSLSDVFGLGVKSLQEECHSLLHPSVGMLLDASYELHSGDARGQANSLSTGLPRDMEFCE